MDLFALLAERGQRIAQAHGHQLAAFQPGRHQTYTAPCVRCGARLTLRLQPLSCGIGGSACSDLCQTIAVREAVAPALPTARGASSPARRHAPFVQYAHPVRWQRQQ
jgi:hypothetical protein